MSRIVLTLLFVLLALPVRADAQVAAPAQRLIVEVVAVDGPFAGASVVVNGLRKATNAGGQATFDLAPGVSLEATFNPDFGQIEADPAVVNLTAF